MTIRTLDDSDVDARADMAQLIRIIEQALRAKAAGDLVAPPRRTVDFPEGDLVMTVGGVNAAAGLRVYGTFSGNRHQPSEFTAVWNTSTGLLEGVVFGSRLGALRTGAIGGAAVRLLSRADSAVLGVIGAGLQAETQIMGIAAVRPIRAVRVFSRSAAGREAFAARLRDRFSLPVEAVPSAEAAVRGADIVVAATKSVVPVIEPSWLNPGAHVTVLAPGGHEIPQELAATAAVIATDSPDQVRLEADSHGLRGSPSWDRIVDLADIAVGAVPGRMDAAQLTLFLSVGLGGTEVACAAHLLRQV